MSIPAVNAPLVYPTALAPGQRIILDRTHARGLRFREINPKEAFTLVDHAGRFFRASLSTLTDEGGDALVYEAMAASPESPAHITLFCAVLARQRMLGVIQKATELGVVRIIPVISERSVQRGGLAHEKAHAWPRQTLRAARQCRRASVPEVRSTVTLAEALDDPAFRDANRRFYLDDRTDDRVESEHTGTPVPMDLALASGPEGGFTDQERTLLRDRNASALCFGGRILRAETAVVVGIARLQETYGDL
jgi:16S rRNA (uracil1498-N3)-methyltransferase